jgi:hypothetical protein
MVETFSWFSAVVVFFAYFTLDVLYAMYIQKVVEKKPALAATIGASAYIASAIGVMHYTQNTLYFIPMVIGSWLGIYVVVKRAAIKSGA